RSSTSGSETLKNPDAFPLTVDVDRERQVMDITWEDGHHSTYTAERLRWACPCAECRGEAGVPGRLARVKNLDAGELRVQDVVLGALVAVLLTAGGGVLAFENGLPTSVAFNLKSGQVDVSTYSQLVFSFSRPVALNAIEAAFSISPATDGAITPVSGQTTYAWSPSKALADLTSYSVTLSPITDLSHRRIPGSRWTFTTNIVPRITTVSGAG